MANSEPVVIASNQTPVPVSTPTLALEAGGNLAAINAKIPASPATEGGNLASINTKIPAQGQALMAGSAPVVIASNQSAVPVTANAGTNLNTSALALEAGNLASINTKIPANPATEGGNLAAINTKLPAALTGGGNLRVAVLEGGTGGGVAQLQVRNEAGAWVNVGYEPTNFDVPVDVGDVYLALKSIINYLARPAWVDPATSRAKTDTSIVGGTLSAVTTLTGITNIGGFPASSMMFDLTRQNWAQTVRACIT